MASVTLLYDYATVNEIRNQSQGIESDELSDNEIKTIANQFGSQLHQEADLSAAYTAATAKWNIAKTYVTAASAAFILAQYKENTAAAEVQQKIADNALNSLKTKGKMSKTSGVNNHAV